MRRCISSRSEQSNHHLEIDEWFQLIDANIFVGLRCLLSVDNEGYPRMILIDRFNFSLVRVLDVVEATNKRYPG